MKSHAINGFLITVVLALIVTAVVYIVIDTSKKHHHGHHPYPPSPNPPHNRPPVGNDRDKHGCLISGGYKWCHSKQRCLKPWEESC